MTIKPISKILGRDDIRSDTGRNLIEHLPQRVVQIYRAQQNDVTIRTNLAELDCLEPGGLDVPQLLLIEQLKVVFLQRGKRLPAVRFHEVSQIRTNLMDRREIKSVGRQLNVQLSKDPAEF